jgi:hypothetical protein
MVGKFHYVERTLQNLGRISLAHGCADGGLFFAHLFTVTIESGLSFEKIQNDQNSYSRLNINAKTN